MARLLSEETAQKLIRLLGSRDAASDFPGHHQFPPRRVIVRCDDATAIGTGWKSQMFPATIVQTAADMVYPPTQTLTSDMIGMAVLLTVLTDGIATTTPGLHKLYDGILLGDVELDAAGSIKGRPRVIAIAQGAAAITHDQKSLTTGFSIASTALLVAVGPNIILPSTGDYYIFGRVSGQLVASFAANERASIFAGVSTNGGITTDDDSQCIVVTTSNNNESGIGTGSIAYIRTGMTAGSSIRLYALRGSTDAFATFSTAQIIANSAGGCNLGYLKIG